MKQRTKIILFAIFSFLLIVNCPGVDRAVLLWLDNEHFEYANQDGSFTFREDFSFKNPPFTGGPFENYIAEYNPSEPNCKLYRLYKINPLAFWRWHHYLWISRKYEYMDWSDIEKKRGIGKQSERLSNTQYF